MIGTVIVKPGVLFKNIAPAGFVILSAITRTALCLKKDLVITSACDGAHSGPNDPHHSGEAYDVRSQGFTEQEKNTILNTICGYLDSNLFYAFLESPGTSNEHFHIQRKKGTVYPPL